MNYFKERTQLLKDMFKTNSKGKLTLMILLCIILLPILVQLLVLWYIVPLFGIKTPKAFFIFLGVGLAIGLIGAINAPNTSTEKTTTSKEITQNKTTPKKQNVKEHKAPIQEGALYILPTSYGKGYDKTIKQHGVAVIQKSNELLPKAAEIISRNKSCDSIYNVMLSDKSTKDNIIILTDCNNGQRFFLSEKEILNNVQSKSVKEKLKEKELQHLQVCEARIKSNLNYPSTYKRLMSKTGWITKDGVNDFVIGFKTKNAFNLELEYEARCFVNIDDEITTFKITEVGR